MLHIYDAETIWYSRLNGAPLTVYPGEMFKDTNDEAVDLLLDASQNFVSFVSDITDENLSLFCRFKSLEGKEYETKVYDIILHCMNHSTFHRGQIITMLRNLDVDELPQTDYITYVRLYP